MNDQPKCEEKVISSSLNQLKYELLTIQSGLTMYNEGLKRIYDSVNKEDKEPASALPQSWEGSSLTGKVKILEELATTVERELGYLNDKLNSLV